jgi:hypothetical protein
MGWDACEPGCRMEANSYCTPQYSISFDKTSNGRAESVIEGNKGSSDGVGQEICVPEIAQHVDMTLKGRSKSGRCDETSSVTFSADPKGCSFIGIGRVSRAIISPYSVVIRPRLDQGIAICGYVLPDGGYLLVISRYSPFSLNTKSVFVKRGIGVIRPIEVDFN